jgi:choline transport protein
VSTLGWQAAAATGTYLGGTIIQGLLVLNDSTYVPHRWHATLILYAVLFLTLLTNTVLVKFLPSLEGLILILHVVGFFAILIPVVHLGPISSASFVFTDFTNLSGYSSSGASWFIGQSASAILFIGYDGACHMGESR